MSELKILLINAMPAGSLNPPFPVLPLGIACIASIGCEAGAEVKTLSGIKAEESLPDMIKNWKPDCVGFQTFINNMGISIRMAEHIKSHYPDVFIVFGGVQATNSPADALASSAVDAVIPSEGELLFKQLLNRLPDSDPLKAPGLIIRNPRGELTSNPGKGLYEDLDDLPPIPYDLFYGNGPAPVGHLLTHRGCPFHCSHCPLKFRSGVPIRSHSSQRVVNTIRDLKTKYNVQHIEFYDENFTMDSDHVTAICHGVKDLDITFSCTARVSQVSLDLCKTMAKAGCSSIIFGLGTGVKRLQDILGTHEDLDHTRQLIPELAQMGIQPVAVFSMGIPTETRRDFRKTVDYALSLHRCKLRFEPAAPLPGSELHKVAQSGGRFLIKSWSEYVHPGQLVYLPAGRHKMEFLFDLYRAKVKARIKHIRDKRFS